MRILISILLVLGFLNASEGFPQSYFDMKPTYKKQVAFFEFLYPRIKAANEKILDDRAFILSLNKNMTIDKNSPGYKRLEKLTMKYGVKKTLDYDKLIKKVDIIPPAMALAQAAVESGWGMSRFVKEGNNLFGHWTYGKVGIMPLRRDPGAKHLIRIFKSIEGSITAYMLNLNKGRAYYDFRNKRAIARTNGKNPSGLALSQTMINYSGIKEKYLRILKRMIKSNKLQAYDKKFYTELNK